MLVLVSADASQQRNGLRHHGAQAQAELADATEHALEQNSETREREIERQSRRPRPNLHSLLLFLSHLLHEALQAGKVPPLVVVL